MQSVRWSARIFSSNGRDPALFIFGTHMRTLFGGKVFCCSTAKHADPSVDCIKGGGCD